MKRKGDGKTALVRLIDRLAPAWRELAVRIHAHPELGLQEWQASAWLTEALAAEGFSVRRNIARLRTAFVAQAGNSSAKPSVAFLAEYDALPGLGHACGHNLICTAAGLAATALARTLPANRAHIQVIGCPAEEFYGGKAQLLQHGAFEGVDMALMAHGYFLALGARPTIARASLIFEFHGRPAHASTAPEQGANALDAMIQTFTAVGLLRQQLRPETRVHGIIAHGGAAANVIPDYTRGEFYVRSGSLTHLEELRKKVVACARAAALATGTRLKVSSEGYDFEPVRPNTSLARAYEDNLRFIGESVDTVAPGTGTGSSDFGNLSRRLPALHGYFRVTREVKRPHSREFALACKSPEGLAGMVVGAKALALSAHDYITRPAFRREVRREFGQRQKMETSHD